MNEAYDALFTAGWSWSTVVLALACYGALHAVTVLRGIRRDLRLLVDIAETRHAGDDGATAEFRSEVTERLRALQLYLQHLNSKMGRGQANDVKVASITADNLVIRSGQGEVRVLEHRLR